jgi:hypothetical protein
VRFRVTTDVPHGNACDVHVTDGAGGDDGVTAISFMPDPRGGPETMWFRFRVERTGEGGRLLRLVLRNPRNMLGGERIESMHPVARRDGGDWERLPAGSPLDLPDGRRHAAWDVEAPATRLDVAWCYPYGADELAALLQETKGAFAADAIGASQGGRPLVRLSNSPGGPERARRGVYVVARQHSGETTGSWVLDGFLRAVAQTGAAAPLVWAVPFADPDGVEEGAYGKDGFPYDLNRAWGRPPMRHETLVIQRDMALWRTRSAPALALDLHSPGACEGEGVYLHVPDPELEPANHAAAGRWVDAFRVALGDCAARDFGRFARYASRWETLNFTKFARATHGVPAFTVETPYALAGRKVLTREDYRLVGARLARAAAELVAG